MIVTLQLEDAMKTVADLIQAFSLPSENNDNSLPIQPLTPERMCNILKKLFGNTIHLINPNLSLQGSPIGSGNKQASAIFGYLRTIQQNCIEEGPTPLSKPIVMILSESPAVAVKVPAGAAPASMGSTNPTDLSVAGSASAMAPTFPDWQTLIIIPPNYQPPAGEARDNNKPVIYYFDPKNTLAPGHVPALVMPFLMALTKGYKAPAVFQGRQIIAVVPPLLPGLGYFNGSRLCTEISKDTAVWALYYTSVAVGTGQYALPATVLSTHQLERIFSQILPENASEEQSSRPSLLQSVLERDCSDAAAPLSPTLSNASAVDSSSSAVVVSMSASSYAMGSSSIALVSSSSAVSPSSMDVDPSASSPSTSLAVTSSETVSLKPIRDEHESSLGGDNPNNRDNDGRDEIKERAEVQSATSTPRTALVSASASASGLVSAREENAALSPGLAEGEEPLLKPLYTIKQIETLLKAYGIPVLPAKGLKPDDIKKLATDNEGHVEVYGHAYQPLQDDLFLHDQIHYWQIKKGRLENRRVTFLLKAANVKQPISVIVELTSPNIHLAGTAWQAYGETPTSDLLSKRIFTSQISTWYANTRIIVLGAASNKTQVDALASAGKKAFQGRISLDFMDIAPSPMASLALLEMTLSLLFHGQGRPIDAATAVKEHRQRSIQAVLKQINEYALNSPPVHRIIELTLRTLCKQNQLILSQTKKHSLPGSDRDSLLKRQQLHNYIKRNLYQLALPDTEQLLGGFSLQDLLLLLDAPDGVGFLQILNEKKSDNRRKILSFEMELQESINSKPLTWRHWAKVKAKDMAVFGYQHSFVAFMKEIFTAMSVLVLEDVSEEQLKQVINSSVNTVERLTYLLTRSQDRAKRYSNKFKDYLGNPSIPSLPGSMGVFGSLLGLGLQWNLGPRVLLDMIGVSLISARLVNAQQNWQIQEESAELREELLKPSNIYRLNYFLLGMIEGGITGNYSRLFGAMGGVAGSVTVEKLAKLFLVRKPNVNDTPESIEARKTLVTLFALCGSALGNVGGAFVYRTRESYLQRTTQREVLNSVIQYVQENSDISLEAEAPSLLRPSLLFSFSNPVRLTWQQEGIAHDAQCDIQSMPILTSSGITGMVCQNDAPNVSPKLRLAGH